MTKVILYPLSLLHDVALPCHIFNGLFATQKERAVIPFLPRQSRGRPRSSQSGQ